MIKVRALALSLFFAILITGIFVPTIRAATTINYGDVLLSSTDTTQSGHFDEKWNLTAGDMVITFTYDANGLVDDFGGGAHAWAELGIRAVGFGDFNPTWTPVEGAGVWLATDYDWAVNTFDPDTLVWYGSPYNGWYGTLDLDDKLILQKAGGNGEGAYNLPSVPPVPGNNHRFWWDRDGVDPWQNGETANTGGFYDIEIYLHATSATTGTAYMKINGLWQGFETDGNWNTIELTPAGMTFSFPPSTCMQVFYGLTGYGATHSMAFKDITVTGVECPPPVGGEWIPIDKLQMMTPLIGWASLATILTATFIGVKRIKKRQN